MIAIPTLAVLPVGYEEVQTLELTNAFRTRTPWVMHLLQPIGHDAAIGDRPAKVCLTGGKGGATHCEDVAGDGYGFQTLKGAAIESLSGKARLKGVTVKAEFGGVSHVLRRTDVWTYQPAADAFERTAGFSRSDLGEEERFTAGPMDGFYIVADFLLSDGETRWSDHRYSVEVYQLDMRYAGYVQVLQYLSPTAYASERNGDQQVIDRELPRTCNMLAVVYPHGVHAGSNTDP